MGRQSLGLAVLALAHGLLYAALTPAWQGPDEIAHFEYAHLLARHGRPLTPADASAALEAEIIDSLYTHRAWDYIGRPAPDAVPARLAQAPFYGRSRTLSRFSLAYVPYALAARPFLDQPVVQQLYVMRLVSVAMGALVVLMTFHMARRLEPDRPALAYGAAGFVLLLPQHAFLMGTVSDGHLAEVLATAGLYALVGIERLGLTWGRALGAALAGAGALLSKTTAYFLAPLAVIAAIDWAWRAYRGARRPGRETVAAVAVGAVLVAAALALLTAVSAQPVAMLRQLLADGAAPGGYGARITALAVEGRLWPSVQGTFTSFWATFGWMAAPLPLRWYAPLGAACGLSALGWALQLRRPGGAPGGYALLALAAALSLGAMWGWMVLSSIGLGVYQGRYLFGVIAAIALLLVRGWLALAPAGRTGWALAVVLGGLVLLDAGALLLVMVPFFQG